MCEPVSTTIAVAAAVTDVAKTITGAVAEHKQHNATVKAANAADTQEQNDLSERAAQEQLAATHDINLSGDQALFGESMARLSAMEAGVTGNSAAGVVGDIEAGRSRYDTSVKENLDMQLAEIQNERAGSDARRTARINGAPDFNPLATGIGIANAGINLYGDLESHKPPTK